MIFPVTQAKTATLTLGAAMLAAALGAASCQPAATTDANTSSAIPHGRLPGNVIPSAYRLDMIINPDAASMSGTVSIDVELTQALSKIWLHGKEMQVSEAYALIGEERFPLSYNAVDIAQAPSGIASLLSERPLPKGQATLNLSYETPYNLALNSAYKVTRQNKDGADDNYIVTQFEPLGAREAFPSFDESKYKVPFTLSITAPADDVVYTNTPLIKASPLNTSDAPDNKSEASGEIAWVKHDFETTRPLPTYLIAFGVGPYDVVEYDALPPTNVRSRAVPLRGLTARGKGSRITYGLKNTAGILEAIEEYFGIPYPYKKLDLIAAPDYVFGAMENPGAIVYREYLMLLDDDAALSQKRAYAGVHSHELAHQWFGNLVTPVWWEDIWLNEAFATWMGNKGTTLWQPEGNYDRNTLNSALGAMNIDTLATTRKIREPLIRSENVMDQFDGITYRKGGGVLSMFESYLGEDKFRDGVRLHMERYADDVASADDFFKSIADGSGNTAVVDAMKSFVDQPGVPIINGVLKHSGDFTSVELTQSRYAPLGSKTQQGQLWQIPVCAKFGYGTETIKSCTLLTQKTGALTSPREGKADWVTLNENGSGYYRMSLGTTGWLSLIENLDKLNTREHLVIQDSLESAFRAGNVEASVFIKGMEAFAKSDEYDVARSAGDWLGWMYNRLPQSARPDIARLTKDMYADRYTRIAGEDSVEGNLLAPTLASRLIGFGGDDALKADFAKKGRAYIAGDKKAVAPNMLSRALGAAMEDGDMAMAAELLEIAKSGSSSEKGAAIGALARTKDKDIANMLWDTALIDSETLTGRQATSLISSLLGSDEFGDQTWDFVTANFKSFVDSRVPDVSKGGMPGLARRFCTDARRTEAKAFFTANADIIPGYERSLAQTLESIQLCAALKQAKAEETVKALAAR